MPTNDERRDVAARLRDMAPGSDWPNYVAEACGMDVSKMSNNFHTFTEQLCQRIADLIEPEEPKAMCVAEVKVDGELLEKLVHDTAVELTGIDRDALLALADEMEEARYDYPEADDALWRFADRVREACGEVSYEE